MILVYTGDGKGKTSASVGQAVRAHGQNMRVAFGQFMKKTGQGGEQVVCASLFKDRYLALGPGFFLNENERPKQREMALQMLEWAQKQIPEVDMLVLDESVYALGYGLITAEELRSLIALARASSVHLILSGRGIPEWLQEEADLVSEIMPRKHPYSSGGKAERGIEF